MHEITYVYALNFNYAKGKKKMTIFLYSIIFIIGTLLGSFCTLAVYRIPLKKDITHEHSFCPNCNHKLAFMDLIPILSYLFLKGKCRYCGQKIRIRYFLLEVFSGLIVLLFAISLHVSFTSIEIGKCVYFFFGILYIVTLTLIAGIDKERKEIQKGVMLFGVITVLTYILYLSIVEQANIDRYAIYLFGMFILFCIDTWLVKKKQKRNYRIEILMLMVLMLLFTSSEIMLLTIAITLIAISIGMIRRRKTQEKALPIGFYLCVSNLIVLIIQNFICFY